MTAATTSVLGSGRVKIMTTYPRPSNARGALFIFGFITNSGDVDFNISFLIALNRNTSHNHTLPFDFYPGRYRMYVYDIEYDAKLHDGVGYPAVTAEIFVGGNGQGKT